MECGGDAIAYVNFLTFRPLQVGKTSLLDPAGRSDGDGSRQKWRDLSSRNNDNPVHIYSLGLQRANRGTTAVSILAAGKSGSLIPRHSFGAKPLATLGQRPRRGLWAELIPVPVPAHDSDHNPAARASHQDQEHDQDHEQE
jgi:hypothetical protein